MESGSPLLRLLRLNSKVAQASDAEIIFNNIVVTERSSAEKKRYECAPFFDMSMEDKYSAFSPEYYRAPNTVPESLLLANFLESYQNQMREEAEKLPEKLVYNADVELPSKREPDSKPARANSRKNQEIIADKIDNVPNQTDKNTSGERISSAVGSINGQNQTNPSSQHLQQQETSKTRRQARDFS